MPNNQIFRLREIDEKDLDMVLRWRNSERIRHNMFTDRVITADEHNKWFNKIKPDSETKCLIFECKGRSVGVVTFTGIDEINNRCHWGFYLGETDMPPGIGSIMGFLALEHAFLKLRVRKVCSEVLAFNKASINLHKKLGFIEEGRLKGHVLKHGKYEDVIIFALSEDEWQLRKKQIEGFIQGVLNHE